MNERSISTVEIEGRTVGPGHPCVFIAEAGSKHNGDLNIAKRQIEIAARAGADARADVVPLRDRAELHFPVRDVANF